MQLACIKQEYPISSAMVDVFHEWCLNEWILNNQYEESGIYCPICKGSGNTKVKASSKNGNIRLGIDIGGVIIAKAEDGDDTSFFSDNYMNTPPEPFVLEAIHNIIAILGPENVYLVSKCGKNFREKTLEWLYGTNFFAKTLLPTQNVRFCDERPQKAEICAELGITHFVDDRLDVLKHLLSVHSMQECFLYGSQEDQQGNYLYYVVTKVNSWKYLEDFFTKERE